METDDILSAALKGDLSRVRFHLENGADDASIDEALLLASKFNKTDVIIFLLENGADIHAKDDTALLWSVVNNHVENIRIFLEKGANVNAHDGKALIYAAKNGHFETVRLLLKYKANVHADNDAPLIWAASEGHLTIVRLLLKYKANVHAVDDYALRCAAKNGRIDVVRLLLEKDANVRAENYVALRTASAEGNVEIVRLLVEKDANVHVFDDSALRMASTNGHVEIVQILLEKGANVHAQDDSALRMASTNGHVEIVQILLEKGANVHAPDFVGEGAALRWASRNGNFEIVHLLVENGANIHAVDDYALRRAAKNGRIDVVRLLLEKDANVRAENDSALRMASTNGHVEIVQILLEKGANVHAQDDSALRMASTNGHVEIVQILLEKGANVHAPDFEGEGAALRWASRNGNFEIVHLLVKKGANIHAVDDYALRFASENGHLNVVRFLIEKDANVRAQDDYALRMASENGNFEIVQFLIGKGANVHADNDYALRLASKNGHLNVVEFLLDNGANVHAVDDEALHLASENEHFDVVDFLINNGANRNALNYQEMENAYYYRFYNQLDDIDIPQSKLDLLLSTEMDERRDLEMVNYLYNRGAVAKITPNYIKTVGEDFPTDELKWRIVMFFVAKGFLPATTDLLAAASNGDADKVAEIITMREFIPQEIIDAYTIVRDSQPSLHRLVLFDNALAEESGELINPSATMAYAIAYAHGHEQVVRVLKPYMRNRDLLPLMTFYLNSLPKLPDISALERFTQLNPEIVDTVIDLAVKSGNLDAVKQFGEKFTTIAIDAIIAKKMNILTYAVRMISEKQLNSDILMETVLEKQDVDALDVIYRFSPIRLNPKQFTEIAVKGLYEFILYLVENGLLQKYKDEALILASKNGNTRLVVYLLKRGADPNAEQRRAFSVAADKFISIRLAEKPSFSLVHRPTEEVDSIFMTPFDPSIAYRMCVNGHSWLYDPVNEVHVCPLCRASAKSELFVNAESGPPVIYTPEPNPGLIIEQKRYTEDEELVYGPRRKLALRNTRRPVYDTEVQEPSDYPYDTNNYPNRERSRRERDAERLIRRHHAQRRKRTRPRR